MNLVLMADQKRARMKALEGEYLRARDVIASGQLDELRLIAFERIKKIVGTTGQEPAFVLGRVAEAIERTDEPLRIVQHYESLKGQLRPVVVDDEPSASEPSV